MDLAIALGQAAGLAVACGLAAFLPFGVGALAAVLGLLPGALGAYDDAPVVAAAWVVGLALAAVTTLVAPRARLVLAALGGAAAFEFAAGDELPWVGIVLGALLGAAAAAVASRIVEGGVRGGGTRSGVAILASAAGLALALAALAPAVGYLLVAGLGWFGVKARRGAQRKYAGLRVLR